MVAHDHATPEWKPTERGPQSLALPLVRQ
jgi:hypothetical protein